jgi:hypothetical protein
MTLRPHTVWNVGLPRTGTTSTTEALRVLGMHCVPVGAQWAMQGGQFPELSEDSPPLLCTVRKYEDWFHSARKYRPSWSNAQVWDLYEKHRKWLRKVGETHSIGYVYVERGYPGLLKALAAAYPDTPYPHLNASPAGSTVQAVAKIAGESIGSG